MKIHRLVVCGILGLLPVHQAFAQENSVTFGGQVRPRLEFRDPGAGKADSFTSMRLRVHVTAKKDKNVSAFIQIQDVRIWGEELGTVTDFRADNIDIQQGYLDLNNIGGSPLSVRAGRQEIVLGGQRLIGALGWAQQGRSFDGLRASISREKGRLDAFAFRLGDLTANPLPPGAGGAIASDAALIGAQGTITSMQNATVDLYALYNLAWSGGANTDLVTMGARYAATRAQWIYRFESSLQVGKQGSLDVAAFMFGGRIGRKIKQKTTVTLWYDYLSGDDKPADGKLNVFNTLFATNHKFYGFYDLFLNIPAHTGGMGLQDIAVKLSATPHESVTFGVDIHSFLLAKKGTLSSGHLAEEIDLIVTHRYANGVSIQGGFAYVIQDDALAIVRPGLGLNKNATWGYLMTSVAF